MKKLKMFFPIFLISILFIPKVSALTTTYNGSLSYNETTLSNINDNQARINAMNTYFENLGTITYLNTNYNINDGTYIIQVSNTSFSSDTWTIKLVNNLGMQWWWRTSDSVGRLTFGGSGLQISVVFSGNNVTSHSVTGVGTYSLEDLWSTNVNWIGNPMSSDIEAKVRNYFDTYFLNSNQNLNFTTYGQSGFYDIPLELNNVVNIPTIYINAKELFDSLMPNLNPYVCSIDTNDLSFRDGVVSNISDFSYNIRADGLTSNDYSIESSFALDSTSAANINFNVINSFNLEVIKGPNSSGQYNVTGSLSYDTETYTIVVNYVVTALTEEPVIVDAIIKLVPTNEYSEDFFSRKLNIYYCIPLDDDQDKDLNIMGGYAYTDNTTGLTNAYDTTLMNFLNNSNNPNLSFFTNIKTVLPLGPVDSILTLPLQVLNSISNALSGNCQNVNITLPYVNSNVELKCVSNFYNSIGASVFFNGVGSVASTFILIQYFTFLYNWIDNILRLGHTKVKIWGSGEV